MLFLYQNEKKCNYISNVIYNKLVTIVIIFSLSCAFLMAENYKNISLNTKYKKIRDFENSYTKSFFYIFFIENEISKIKKFWKINRRNQLIVRESYVYKKTEIPDISIIITIYNQVNCFYRALRSVQNQSLQNLEIIIVDE